MITASELKAIGKFQKTHALKGELNALLDISPEYVSEGNAIIVEMDGIYVPFFASSIRAKGNVSYLIKIDGVDSEEEAKKFVNKTLYGLREDLVDFLELTEDELYDDEDLIGYVINDSVSGIDLGKITDVDSSTDNILFIVETPTSEILYIPAVDDFIDRIDDANKTIYMTLPDGLVNLNKKDF